MKTSIIKSRFKQDGSICYLLFVNDVPIQAFESKDRAQRKIKNLNDCVPYRNWLVEYADRVKTQRMSTYNRIYERVKE